MKDATQVYDWLVENTESFTYFRKNTLSTLLYLLGAASKGQLTYVELCDSDFPAFNDVLELPESELFILPFIDWQTLEWQYDPVNRIAV